MSTTTMTVMFYCAIIGLCGASMLFAFQKVMRAGRLWDRSVKDVAESAKRQEIELDKQKRLNRPG